MLIIYIEKVDCGIQVSPRDDLKKEEASNINVKVSSENGKKVSDKSSLLR